MRLVDAVFRGGHLSEATLVEAVMTGDRPAHMERCDICAERAVEIGRWLDQVQQAGVEAADAAFPAERLAAQQHQILRRLEQLEQPARVIAFPSHTQPVRESGRRGVAPAWLGVAAAAGLVLGIVGGQFTARGNPAPTPPTVMSGAGTAPALPGREVPALNTPSGAVMTDLERPLERVRSANIAILDEMTPTLVARAGG